mmetsp:Transcript_22566/g.62642  ORF Transcript_22566/g.62642 Transcript_22566/m.62642 type:complete len:89 (-) Transcript_22566:360-626(-)
MIVRWLFRASRLYVCLLCAQGGWNRRSAIAASALGAAVTINAVATMGALHVLRNSAVNRYGKHGTHWASETLKGKLMVGSKRVRAPGL